MCPCSYTPLGEADTVTSRSNGSPFITVCNLELHFRGRIQDLTICMNLICKIKNITGMPDPKSLRYFVLPNAEAVHFNNKPDSQRLIGDVNAS